LSKIHVKKNDTVVVLTGKDRGKKGKVIFVAPKDSRVIVEGVHMQTKHKKAKSAQQQSGIVKQEGTIHSSNVMFFCDKCDSPSKIGRKILESGDKARVCKKCNEVIDIVKEK
jgi:large subunit ribosomal protein L24